MLVSRLLTVGAMAMGGTLPTLAVHAQTFTTLYTFDTPINRGGSPYGGVVAEGGFLYGTTGSGGEVCHSTVGGCGTVFKFNRKTGRLATLYSFKGGALGFLPNDTIVYQNGSLYGTTLYGGTGCKP